VEFVFVLNIILPALFTILTAPPSRFIVIDCADELSSLKLKLNVLTERERDIELLIELTFAFGVAKLDVVIFVDSIVCVVISFAVISDKIQVEAVNTLATANEKLPLNAFILVRSNSSRSNSSIVKVLIFAVVAFNKGVEKRNVASPSIHSNTSASNSTTFKVSVLISSACRFNVSIPLFLISKQG